VPDWKNTDVLQAHQTEKPILWWEMRDLPDLLPDTSDEALASVFPPGGGAKLRTWHHAGDDKKGGVHFLSTRAGTPMHSDPAFWRYTHHLVLRNDGLRVHGLEQDDGVPRMEPGLMLCLDTWSPHQVSVDPRMTTVKRGTGLYKVAVAVDREQPLGPNEAWSLLSSRLEDRSVAVDAA
jgi:hypothetical protein